jgi:hypothetical protein
VARFAAAALPSASRAFIRAELPFVRSSHTAQPFLKSVPGGCSARIPVRVALAQQPVPIEAARRCLATVNVDGRKPLSVWRSRSDFRRRGAKLPGERHWHFAQLLHR